MNAIFRDGVNFISKLTFERTINFAGVFTGYLLSKFFKRPFVFGMPFSVSIEPTTSCNLRCPECPSGLRAFTRPTGMLAEGFYRDITDQLCKKVSYLNFYFQGEPFLHPNFLAMIRYASEKKIYTATSTNAHFLDDETAKKTVESGLDRLIISIDGTTDDTYKKYRIGGSLQKVLDGTRNIVAWKKKLNSSRPFLIFQFLVVRPNEHQIEEAKLLAGETGVDKITFKTAQIYNYKTGNDLIPLDEKYSRYRKMPNGEYALKNSMRNHCWKLWHSTVITWDGKALPCCFDKDASHPMGDLNTNRFKEIWKSESYNKFRSSVLKSRKENDICSNCSEGTRVFS